MKRIVLLAIFILALFFLSSLTTSCVTTSGGPNAGYNQSSIGGKEIMAGIGGVIGAVLGKKHPVLGALVGGGAGWLLGYAIEDIAKKASQEAALQNRRVEYYSPDRSRQVIATPVGFPTAPTASASTNKPIRCQKVQTIIIENGKEIANYTDDVCPI